MTNRIETIRAIASNYDVIVFDQWGVLHDGTSPYSGAIAAIKSLPGKTAVLSNSGKRAAPNLSRIASMGFPASGFDYVMTSGEALWQDIAQGAVPAQRFFAVERALGDAKDWAQGLSIDLVDEAEKAEAILLMGLPDGAALDAWQEALKNWRARDLPLYCSNPDRQSPRAEGLVISPGALAFRYQDMGGRTTFYGKPHLPVFHALERVFGPGQYLMVGDSMEHDIAGGQTAGWDTLLVEGGLYEERFAKEDAAHVLAEIAAEKNCALPTYHIKGLC